MKVQILNSAIDEVFDVADEVFNVEPRSDILARVVNWQLAKRRSGTHKAKDRGDVRGTTAKMYKQKGTGQARHGSKRGAQFRGGGIIFGPVVRSHEYSLPKKIRALGLRMALSSKMREGNLFVVNDLKMPDQKVKTLLQAFLFSRDKSGTLLIDSDRCDYNAKMAVSNIHYINLLPQIGANVYDILKHQRLVLSIDAVRSLEARLIK